MEELRVTDTIFISDLEIATIIGVYDWEREEPRPLFIDLEIGCDISASSNSDNIADTIDYDALSKEIGSFASKASYQLIEAFAEAIAQIILSQNGCKWVRLKVNKPGAIENAASVGISIFRKATSPITSPITSPANNSINTNSTDHEHNQPRTSA